MNKRPYSRRSRRAAVLALSAFLMVFMLGMVAFSIDLGYLVLTHTQLQVSADSAAMAAASTLSKTSSEVTAAAQQYAAYHKAGGKTVSLNSTDVENGKWDAVTRTFTPSATVGNAVRVTAHRNDSTGGNNFFFARIFGINTFTTSATAIAMGSPRDIAFVVDLSGSMNDDAEPCWATNEITNEFSPQGFATIGTDMIQDMYTDFGWGAYPGTLQWVGSPAGVTANSSAYANLTKDGGYLTGGSIAATYKILSGDSESARKTKAYRWIIDNQLAVVMPLAKPTPSSSNSTSYNYWVKYLDYVIQSTSVSGRGTLPPSQDSDRITGFNNPNSASYPSASSSVVQSYRNKLGYVTYLQFMCDFGRNYQPDGSSYVPLSVSSPYCPFHSESTAGGTFNFPPREQPTHASRRSLIAAMQEVKARNNAITDINQRDWVSVISFDTVSGTVTRQSLTSNYDNAMQVCTTLQAVGDNASSTATETGLIAAKAHLAPAAQGGLGRATAQKVVVLLTDGMPNLKSSSDSAVSAARSANASSDYYGGSSKYPADAALTATMALQLQNWKVFSVGLGLGCDYDFMDRLARIGKTASESGLAPRTSGNPTAYETELSSIFKTIITNPQVRLVK